MRRFSLGSATDRKIVVIELDGSRMSVVQMLPDGSSKRNKKELASAAEARAASERMAQELIARGFVEQANGERKPARSARPGVPATKPAAPAAEPEALDGSYLFAEVEDEPVAPAVPVLSRLSAAAGRTGGRGTRGEEKEEERQEEKEGSKQRRARQARARGYSGIRSSVDRLSGLRGL